MIHARTAVVVEDDTDVGDVISSLLDKAGFEVTIARTGAEALAVIRDQRPDLVTLDMTLPDIDGVEVCRQIRLVSDCYVIVISGRTAEVDRLMGLEVGADPAAPTRPLCRCPCRPRWPRSPGSARH
jgi:two-component system OmpR family response regulator